MDALLAIVEILSNLAAFGDRADEYKLILNEEGVMETAILLMKHLKETTDILIEHKIFEQEEKFATFTSKAR